MAQAPTQEAAVVPEPKPFVGPVQVYFVPLGHFRSPIDFDGLQRLKSEILSVIKAEQEPVRQLTNPSAASYTDDELSHFVGASKNGALAVGVIDAPLKDEYYLRRLSKMRAVISVHQIAPILEAKHYKIEQYIRRNVYQVVVACYKFEGALPPTADEKLSHDEIRGCIFDWNADHADIVNSLNSPTLCVECRKGIGNRELNNHLPLLDKELRKIRKSLVFRVVDFVERRPLVALAVTLAAGISVNLIASVIYDLAKSYGVPMRKCLELLWSQVLWVAAR